MTKTIAFVGQKGGASKSTCAASVSCELLARGRSVLAVDADPQGTLSTFGAVAGDLGHPSPTFVAMGEGMHRPDQLPKVGAPFDWVVIDCPPRHGAIQRSALMACDVAILVCGPSPADAWALASSVELVREAMAVRPELLAAVLITKVTARTALAKGIRDVLAAAGLPLLSTTLGYRMSYQEALAAGLGAAQYAPKDATAREVRALVTELEIFAGASAPLLRAGGIA